MDTIQDILLIALLLGGLVLMIVVIIVLLRLRTSIDILLSELRKFGERSEPILENLEKVTERTDETLTMIVENREAITESVEYARKIMANIHRLEHTVQREIEPALMGITRRLVGLYKGIEAFVSSLSSRR